MIQSGSAVKIAPKKLCSIPALPEAGVPVWGRPFPAWSTDSEIATSQEGGPIPLCSWVPAWSPACISRTRHLYWWAVTPHLPPSSRLKGYLYVLLYVSLKSYCSSLEPYITAESLTHLSQCISQCSCGKSGRMPLEGGASTVGSDSC